MILLLAILAGFTVNGSVAQLPYYPVYIICDGDSNTNSPYQGDSTWVDQMGYNYSDPRLEIVNVGYGGKQVYHMVRDGARDIDIYDSPFKVCFLAYGGNDAAAGTSADSIYTLIQEFCNDRRAEGFYTIVIASQTHHLTVMPVTDSVKVNWADFADDIVLVCDDPNIGYESNTSDTTYWYDIGHLTVTGLGIYADSCAKHLESYIYASGRL